MRITTWNARGLNAPSKKRLIQQYLKNFNLEIILIQETKLNQSKGLKLNKMLGIQESSYLEAIGAFGGLGIIWNSKKVDLHYLKGNSNWMCARVQSLKSDLNFILINVYGPNSGIGKKEIWDLERNLQQSKPLKNRHCKLKTRIMKLRSYKVTECIPKLLSCRSSSPVYTLFLKEKMVNFQLSQVIQGLNPFLNTPQEFYPAF